MAFNLLLVGSSPGADAVLHQLKSLQLSFQCFDNSLRALQAAVESPPSAVLIDASASSFDAVQLCRSLRSFHETYTTPVVALFCAAPKPEDRLLLLESGADDCWIHAADSPELSFKLRSLARRFAPARRDRVLRYADLELDLDQYKVRRNGKGIPLTPTQFRLLKHFMDNPLVVFSQKQLIEHVWRDSEIDEPTVNAFVNRLKKALNVAGSNLIRNVRGFGYALDGDAPDGAIK